MQAAIDDVNAAALTGNLRLPDNRLREPGKRNKNNKKRCQYFTHVECVTICRRDCTRNRSKLRTAACRGSVAAEAPKRNGVARVKKLKVRTTCDKAPLECSVQRTRRAGS